MFTSTHFIAQAMTNKVSIYGPFSKNKKKCELTQLPISSKRKTKGNGIYNDKYMSGYP